MTNTGPAYPFPPGAGSNAIGVGAIGEMQIGDIEPFSIWSTILSQYANSPILTAIIQDMQAWLDQTENFDSLYDNIWDVSTAQGYGLDCWGRIVGVTRVLTIPAGDYFGFKEAGSAALEFNQGAFYSGAPITSNYALSDNAFRTLIFAKAQANISNGSYQSINQILMSLFPNRGNAYVQDNSAPSSWFGFEEASPTSQPFNQASFYTGSLTGGMAMTYVFNFPLQPFELAIVQTSGVLPKPVGVAASVLITG